MPGVVLAALTAALAGGIAVENDLAVLKFDGQGRIASLVVKADGAELVREPRTFCWTGDAKCVQPERMERRGEDRFAWLFPERQGGGEAVFRIASFGPGWTFEVVDCTVPSAAELHFGRLAPKCRDYTGRIANMLSDDAHCVCLRGYAAKCRMAIGGGELRVSVGKRLGFAGTKAGLIAARREDTRAALKAMTAAAGVFTTVNGGPNSLGSEANRGSYCFADLWSFATEDWIDYALRGGFDTIHLHGWWETRGSYPIKERMFPGGEAGWRQVCDQIHAAGLRVGMHTLSYNIQPKDALCTPECSEELMDWCTVTLAKELKPDDAEMFVEEKVDRENFHTFHSYGSKGNTFRYGHELITYSGVDSARRAFTGVTRGGWNTRKGGVIPAGSKLHYLYQRYDAFFADPEAKLGEEVGRAIARVRDAGKVDQIYLDGAEAIREDRDYANDRLREHIVKFLDPSMLIEGSNGDAFTWWYLSRFGAWDRPYWGMKRMHDDHLRDVTRARRDNFLESQMGWWHPETGNWRHPPHKLDDMEYFAARNTALDTSMSVQGPDVNTAAPLPQSVVEQLTLLGWYERFRMARAFSKAAMDKLTGDPRGETKLKLSQHYGWQLYSSDPYSHRVTGGDDTRAWSWNLRRGASDCALRVEALYYADETSTNRVTLIERASVDSSNRMFKAEWPLQPYRNCRGCYAFSVDVKGDGSGAEAWIILGTPRIYHQGRSYHKVKLDFTGWRHFTFPLRERDMMEAYDRRWEGENAIHPMVCCATPLDMEHLLEARVVLNELPAGREVRAEIRDLVALPAIKRAVKRSSVVFGETVVPVPFEMESGDFAELEDGVWRHYRESGELKGQARGNLPRLGEGARRVSYEGELADGSKAARAEVTYFARHSPVTALKGGTALEPALRKALAYEAVMPSRYCPAKGLVKIEDVIVRQGEKAAVELTLYGPIDTPVITFCGSEWRFPVKLERGERLYCKDGASWRQVDGRRRVLASGKLERPLPVLASGMNRLTLSCADDSKADCRVDIVKHYTEAPSWFEAHLLKIRSSIDGTEQPSYFFPAETKEGEKAPLLVVFHTWSYNMWEQTYDVYSDILAEARRLGWSVLCPNFRGPNNTPQGCGSDLATGDIKDAIDHVKAHYSVDEDRVYAMGGSGGGHMTLLLAGRHPEIWAGCAAFCPPADLIAWHARSKALGHDYWRHLEQACGGTPEERREEYLHRSPVTNGAVIREKGVNVMLIAGIHDGIKGKGSVAVSIVSSMFNAIAEESDRLPPDFLEYVDRNESVPDEYRFRGRDPFYGRDNYIHFRRTSGNVQYTIFEGGHGGNTAAAIDWLSRQRRGVAADWSLPGAGSSSVQQFTK